MEVIDNFELIKKHINCGNDEFFLCQVIQRGKDQINGCNSKQRTIRSYYVSNPEYLDEKKSDIITMCEKYNARAYINLNKKSKKQIALKSLENIAHMISSENYKGLFSVIDSSCGQTGACDGNKTWLVDIDSKETCVIEEVIDVINECEPFGVEKVVEVVPTLHGYHLITKPFNKKKFRDNYNDKIDIHDNNPTLLYYCKKD